MTASASQAAGMCGTAGPFDTCPSCCCLLSCPALAAAAACCAVLLLLTVYDSTLGVLPSMSQDIVRPLLVKAALVRTELGTLSVDRITSAMSATKTGDTTSEFKRFQNSCCSVIRGVHPVGACCSWPAGPAVVPLPSCCSAPTIQGTPSAAAAAAVLLPHSPLPALGMRATCCTLLQVRANPAASGAAAGVLSCVLLLLLLYCPAWCCCCWCTVLSPT